MRFYMKLFENLRISIDKCSFLIRMMFLDEIQFKERLLITDVKFLMMVDLELEF